MSTKSPEHFLRYGCGPAAFNYGDEIQRALNARLTVKPDTLLTAKKVRDLYLDVYPALSKYWEHAYGKDRFVDEYQWPKTLTEEMLEPPKSAGRWNFEDFFQAQPRAERAMCSRPELAMGYGREDKTNTLSAGVKLRQQIADYIARENIKPLTLSQEEMLTKSAYSSTDFTNKEPVMTTIKIETKTFITAPGITLQDAATVSPAQVATAIQRIDAEIKTYEGLSTKPASVVAHIASLHNGLQALVRAVDAANPATALPTSPQPVEG